MPASDVFVSVVAPIRDDAGVLDGFVAETAKVLEEGFSSFELVLVDDGSRDGTADRVGALLGVHRCIRYLRLTRAFGTEAAIAAGLDTVIGDFTVILQPGIDPPALIPDLVRAARAGKGVAFGVRSDRTGDPAWARAGSRLFWGFSRRFLGVRVPEGATYFQCLSRNAVNAVTRTRDRYRSMRLLASQVGEGVEPVAYVPVHAPTGPGRRGVLASLDLAVGITVSHSTRPLRFVAGLGLLASVLNLIYAGYVVAIFLFKRRVAEGWTTTSLQLSGMFFLLFLIVAVLSEYMSRILEEVRDRPLYHVLEERNSSVMVSAAERRNVVRDSA